MKQGLEFEKVSKLVSYKFGYDRKSADSVTEGLFQDEIPRNGIKTYGDLIWLLDYINKNVRIKEK